MPVIRDFKADYTVSISAKTKAGLGDLLETIEALLRQQKVYIEEVYPYSEAGRSSLFENMENYWKRIIQKKVSRLRHMYLLIFIRKLLSTGKSYYVL